MSIRKRTRGIATILLVGVAGCMGLVDPDGDDDVGQVFQDVVVNNGTTMNGISLNGISLNGISLNGISLNGISLNGISLNGISLNGISLNGISLNGTTLAAVVGSTWNGTLSNGGALPMRIDSATRGTGGNSDVGMYAVSYQTTSGWKPLCGLASDVPVLALSVQGSWDQRSGVTGGGAYASSSTLQTFACRGNTIAKCVEMGYKTWTGRTSHLETCVRLLRGDYCGDGTPSTVTGTTINLYDNVGIQSDAAAWKVEGEWTPAGVRCISRETDARFNLVSHAKPWCFKSEALKPSNTCGTFANGALLIDELP